MFPVDFFFGMKPVEFGQLLCSVLPSTGLTYLSWVDCALAALDCLARDRERHKRSVWYPRDCIKQSVKRVEEDPNLDLMYRLCWLACLLERWVRTSPSRVEEVMVRTRVAVEKMEGVHTAEALWCRIWVAMVKEAFHRLPQRNENPTPDPSDFDVTTLCA